MMKLAEYVGGVGQDVYEYRVLVVKPKGRSSLGRLRCRQQDGESNIETYVEQKGVACFRLARDSD
jgi:hypothetical protein